MGVRAVHGENRYMSYSGLTQVSPLPSGIYRNMGLFNGGLNEPIDAIGIERSGQTHKISIMKFHLGTQRLLIRRQCHIKSAEIIKVRHTLHNKFRLVSVLFCWLIHVRVSVSRNLDLDFLCAVVSKYSMSLISIVNLTYYQYRNTSMSACVSVCICQYHTHRSA